MKPALLAALGVLMLGCTRQPPPSNDLVFVSNEAGHVTILGGATGKVEGELATGPRPRGIEFSRDRRTLYVAASNANRIEAWDIATRKLLRSYRSGSDPERFSISPDGATAYVANEDKSAVSSST